MIRFDSDYVEGMHPSILKKLIESNDEQLIGYGNDPHCARAKDLIKKACKNPEADVHFFTGGTITNVAIISHALRPYQAVIAADSGHIETHETGALEARGHKIITLSSDEGKIPADRLQAYMEDYLSLDHPEHVVEPKMVYISQPTELGTLYSAEELRRLHELCRHYDLYLFLDGARLGYALAAEENDLSLEEICQLTDVFYIGGTKVGAMFGEAVVISRPDLKPNTRHTIKQSGSLLAKGRYFGLQFESLFEDGLYLTIARHAINCASQLRDAFRDLGYRLPYPSPSNQLFPLLSPGQIDRLAEDYAFDRGEIYEGDLRLCRFCTSWATKPENIEALIADLEKVKDL